MTRFIDFFRKSSKTAKYSSLFSSRLNKNHYVSPRYKGLKLSEHDVQLQEYRIVDIYNQGTSVF